MKLLILEDDHEIRETIEEMVKVRKLFDEVVLADTIEEAMVLANNKDIDMFIVDLNLPDGSGHEFINDIRSLEYYQLTWVIITTGIDESVDQVIDAYNSRRCQRYIKKPFGMTYLAQTIEELQEYKVVEANNDGKLRIKRKSMDYHFHYEDIVYIETVDKTAYIYTKDKKYPIGRMTLSELDSMLPKQVFLRVHRSYIVNKYHVDHIMKNNNQNIIKIKYYDQLIPIGRTYKKAYDKL